MSETTTPIQNRISPVGWLSVVLLLALAGTSAWRMAVVRGATDVTASQKALVEQALDHAQDEFRKLEQDAIERGRLVARDSRLVQALRRRTREVPGVEPAVVEVISDLELDPMIAIEIYDPTPRLLAWNGYAMPMDSAPERPEFLSADQVVLARDGTRRVAVAGWVPILDGTEVIGVVRILRLLERRMPVRNDYLRDYAVAIDWSRDTGLPVSVTYMDGSDVSDEADNTAVLSSAVTGESLLTVAVQAPSADLTRRMAVTRLDGWLALWSVIIILLTFAIAARWAMAARRPNAGVRCVALLAAGAVCRYAFLMLDVPNRWQTGKAPLSPLFDTAHMASAWGFGIVGSIGDLVVTGLIAVGVAGIVARIAFAAGTKRPARPNAVRGLVRAAAFGVGAAVAFGLAASLAGHVLLDSTLEYFARSGLLPPRLVVVVFAGLLIVLLAALVLASALARSLDLPVVGVRGRTSVALVGSAGAVITFLTVFRPVTWTLVLALLLFALVAVALGVPRSRPLVSNATAVQQMTARNVLFGVIVLCLILYPVLDQGHDADRRARMLDAAESFAEDRDPRVLFSVESALSDARLAASGIENVEVLDSLLEANLQGSLLATLGTYEVTISILDDSGRRIARSGGRQTPAAMRTLDEQDGDDLNLLQGIQRERGRPGMVVEKLTSPVEFDRFDYVGAVPVDDESGRWVLVRAAQHEHLPAGSTPFPRVLVPSGYYGTQYPDLSIAEFRDDVLVRSFGATFGRSYLDQDVVGQLRAQGTLWRQESLRDRGYLTYYAVRNPIVVDGRERFEDMRTVAVRQAAINMFDRLYFLLRLTLSGLLVGLLVYVVGLVLRRRAGVLPAPRVRFRDRVLNAFFAVGIVTVAAMGALGLRVVTGENERAIESWLRQHLERVEDALLQDARGDELPYRVLERIDVDSLAARVGLDLNIYRGFELASTSRPQLIRDRLIPHRVPIAAYQALFVDGYRFTDVDEQLGEFRYTAGYRSLSDEQGVPRYVISVPTLPEQERIEEERARTVAYLFGALLLLVLVVMATAALIANALALPVARLRGGLERIAEGRFDRIQPLNTRDEMGELVGTFNTMQDQLAESRRLLALQERQLAWREMARQVAHEIKNPLTPMKLSVQHLRRAHDDRGKGRPFDPVFERITTTLIDQIDALARIANEFSSFARMPLQTLEPLDVNGVVREAAELMQVHSPARIVLALHETPLIVEADREALRRVFINFVKNAVESLAEGAEGHIRMSSRPEQDADTGLPWAVITVSDNGTGIPDDLREKIFTPSFSTKTSGTGLGLAIARNTVEELRGRIGFETEVGRGSDFWVRIPLFEGEMPASPTV